MLSQTRIKARAAALREIGLPRPYVESSPLAVEELELDPRGRGEVLVRVAAARPLPFRPLGGRQLARAPGPHGAGARSVGDQMSVRWSSGLGWKQWS